MNVAVLLICLFVLWHRHGLETNTVMLVRRGGKREGDHSQAVWENHWEERHWLLTMAGARAASDGGSAHLAI